MKPINFYTYTNVFLVLQLYFNYLMPSVYESDVLILYALELIY